MNNNITKYSKWVVSEDTGISSRTIWAVMMNAVVGDTDYNFRYGTPRDPDDFGRCYRLLERFPEWKTRLGEVANIFPRWTGLVREWDTLTKLYEESGHNYSDKLYNLMQQLNDESLITDGWTRTSPCGWEKKK